MILIVKPPTDTQRYWWILGQSSEEGQECIPLGVGSTFDMARRAASDEINRALTDVIGLTEPTQTEGPRS